MKPCFVLCFLALVGCKQKPTTVFEVAPQTPAEQARVLVQEWLTNARMNGTDRFKAIRGWDIQGSSSATYQGIIEVGGKEQFEYIRGQSTLVIIEHADDNGHTVSKEYRFVFAFDKINPQKLNKKDPNIITVR